MRRASRSFRDLVKTDANNLVWRRDFSISLNRVGDVKRDSGNTQGALASYEESLAIRRRLAAADPGNVQWRSDEAYVLQRIGDLKRSSSDNQGALAAFEEALAIVRGFADQNPGTDTRRELALNLTKVGAVKRDLGDRDGALAALTESLTIRRALPQTDLTKWQIDVAENLETIGDLKLAAGDKPGALELYEEMLALDRTMVAKRRRQRPMAAQHVDQPEPGRRRQARARRQGRRAQGLRGGTRRPPRPRLADKTVPRLQDVALNLEQIGDLKRGAERFRRCAQGV